MVQLGRSGRGGPGHGLRRPLRSRQWVSSGARRLAGGRTQLHASGRQEQGERGGHVLACCVWAGQAEGAEGVDLGRRVKTPTDIPVL